MTNYRTMMIALAATGLIGSQTLAAETAPLPAGKPAGVRSAQGSPTPLLALGAVVLIGGAVGIAMAVDDSGGSCGAACNPPTTGTTP
ncbi:MAG TPA: hypothetical protein VHM27_03230 [Rhizomicrobium sp.]|jgi:hypothetical protein|nr:hypothetical protein [Rhizomicrobium sp.]